MERRYKTTTPAPVELALGLLAAVVYGVTQGLGWLRLLVGGVALALALVVVHTAATPVRGAASISGANVTVLAPPRVTTAAPALVLS